MKIIHRGKNRVFILILTKITLPTFHPQKLVVKDLLPTGYILDFGKNMGLNGAERLILEKLFRLNFLTKRCRLFSHYSLEGIVKRLF